MNEMLKNLLLWFVIALVLISVFSNFGGPRFSPVTKLSYSQFMDRIDTGEINEVVITEEQLNGTSQGGEVFTTQIPVRLDSYWLDELRKKGVVINAKAKEQQSLLMHIFISWFPVILFIGVWMYFMRQMQGGGGRGGAMSFGRSRARLLGEDQVKVTFADVAGVEEAKEEVKELVDFLKDPNKYHNVGGKIPSGVLLIGQPGTGKTLLAKAIAGEAKVPFFTISGSDFVEMFVGVGASRVRDMFEQAKKHAPCIIFIDEIDAVGRHRGSGVGGGHDEREQTLNQLLVEMDGFEGNEGVIVIAATNRPDVLDPALLRPGRFDRQVSVGLPDLRGREQILKVHMRKLKIIGEINTRDLARNTPGFSGADLENLVNEAALLTARDNKLEVDMDHFERAKDKVIMGVERRSLVMNESEKKLTAYHEAGHAIVGLKVPEHDPVYKVTIIPRNRALGVTFFLPEHDKYSISKRQLESQVSSLFGGRVAEELIFGKDCVTTGASNDFQKATQLCRNMVTKWGLSDKLGPLTYDEDEGEVFLGHPASKHKEVSEETSRLIDQEIRVIIDRNYARSVQILNDNIDILHAMAEALLKYETIDKNQIKDIMERREPSEPAGWSDDLNNKDNKNSPYFKPEKNKTSKADNYNGKTSSQET